VDQVFQTMFSGVWEEIKHEENPVKRLRMRGEAVLKYHPEFLDILLESAYLIAAASLVLYLAVTDPRPVLHVEQQWLIYI